MSPPRLACLVLAVSIGGPGCKPRRTEAPTAAERAKPTPKLFDDAGVESRTGGAAGTAQAPIPRCGPKDSYRYVADDFRCPGGGNPFEGDATAAARSRAGSLGPTDKGHMIDVYQVPCPMGKVEVFVDMYACPEMEAQLVQDAAGDPLQLDVQFAAGRYAEVRDACDSLADSADGEPATMSLYHCGIFTPALLLRAGERDKAIAAAGRTCKSYPPVSARSAIRVEMVVGMVDAIARMWAADKVPVAEGTARLNALIDELLRACSVDAATFMSAFEAATGG